MQTLKQYIVEHQNTPLKKLTFVGSLGYWVDDLIANYDGSAIMLYSISNKFNALAEGLGAHDRGVLNQAITDHLLEFLPNAGDIKYFKQIGHHKSGIGLCWNESFIDTSKRRMIFEMIARGWMIINSWFINQKDVSESDLFKSLTQQLDGKELIDIFNGNISRMLQTILKYSRPMSLNIIMGGGMRSSSIYEGWMDDINDLCLDYQTLKTYQEKTDEGSRFGVKQTESSKWCFSLHSVSSQVLNMLTAPEVTKVFENEIKALVSEGSLGNVDDLEIQYINHQYEMTFSDVNIPSVGSIGAILLLLDSLIDPEELLGFKDIPVASPKYS